MTIARGKVLSGIELDHARAVGEEDFRAVKCGFHCQGCRSFWTFTGWGEPWHEPGCEYAEDGRIALSAELEKRVSEIADLKQELRRREGMAVKLANAQADAVKIAGALKRARGALIPFAAAHDLAIRGIDPSARITLHDLRMAKEAVEEAIVLSTD